MEIPWAFLFPPPLLEARIVEQTPTWKRSGHRIVQLIWLPGNIPPGHCDLTPREEGAPKGKRPKSGRDNTKRAIADTESMPVGLGCVADFKPADGQRNDEMR